MFYKQTVNNIKLVVLSLDGGLLDLNRLRYNYFKRIAKTYNYEINKEDFNDLLGNMNTMYSNSKIGDQIDSGDINKLIERDLFQYARLRPDVIKKDGVEELLAFLHQKNIKIAVVSTHRIKRAIQYLQLTRMYDQVDFIIGGDSDIAPLPEKDILETVMSQMEVTPKNTLVVANFPALIQAANKAFCNVVYLNDLVEADKVIKASAFKVARNNLEVINVFLFSGYDSMDIFSPLLGMSEDMDMETLEETYRQLLIQYEDDDQLTKLVNETYEYYLSRIPHNVEELFDEDEEDSVEEIDEEVEEEPISPEDEDSFEDPDAIEELKKNIQEVYQPEVEDDDDEPVELPEEKVIEENLKDHKEDFKIFTDPESIEPAPTPVSTITQTLKPGEFDLSKTQPVIDFEPERLNELMDIINGTDKDDEDSEDDEDIKDDDDDYSEKKSIGSRILTCIYILLVTILVHVIGLFGYTGFEDFIKSDNPVASVIRAIVEGYMSIVEGLYGLIFNGLHSLISAVPDYDALVKGNDVLSSMAIKMILFVIFALVVIGLVYAFIYLFTEEEYVDDEEDI